MKMRRWVWYSLLLVLSVVSVVTAATRPRTATRSDSFTAVAKRAEKAVIRGDWQALRRDAEPEICLAQYMRGYTQDMTTEQQRALWPDIFNPRKTMNADDDGVMHAYGVVYQLVNTRKPLTAAARDNFQEFCSMVQDSFPRNEISLRSKGVDVPEIIGPAVSGKYVSNTHWRIELSRNTGRWRVSRLVLELH